MIWDVVVKIDPDDDDALVKSGDTIDGIIVTNTGRQPGPGDTIKIWFVNQS